MEGMDILPFRFEYIGIDLFSDLVIYFGADDRGDPRRSGGENKLKERQADSYSRVFKQFVIIF